MLGLKQLRYFVAIAEAGALSRAAGTLAVAQSALSHHVAELEARLGVSLLERKARGVTLTAAGHRLREHAVAVLGQLAKAEEDVRTFTEAAAGPVSVGLSHTAIDLVVLDLMKFVRAACPGVRLTIVEGLSPTLIDRVLAGTLDIALAYNPPKGPRLTIEPLIEEDLYLVGQPNLIGRSSRPVPFSAIPKDSVLGLSPVPASRAIIEAQILRNRVSPNPALEIDSLPALRLALEAGLGTAILSKATVRAQLEAGRFASRRIIKPDLTRTLFAVTLADRPHTRALTKVRETAVDVVRASVHSGRWPGRVVEARRSAAAI